MRYMEKKMDYKNRVNLFIGVCRDKNKNLEGKGRMVHRKMYRDRRTNNKNNSFDLYKKIKELASINRQGKMEYYSTKMIILYPIFWVDWKDGRNIFKSYSKMRDSYFIEKKICPMKVIQI